MYIGVQRYWRYNHFLQKIPQILLELNSFWEESKCYSECNSSLSAFHRVKVFVLDHQVTGELNSTIVIFEA